LDFHVKYYVEKSGVDRTVFFRRVTFDSTEVKFYIRRLYVFAI